MDRTMVTKLILDASSYQKGVDLAKQATASINKELELWKVRNNTTNDSIKTLTQQAKANAETQKVLTAQIDLTKQKLQEVTAAQGENSKAALTLQNKLTDLEIAQAKLNKEIGGGLTPLQNFKNGLVAAGDKMKSVGDKMASFGKSMSMYVTAPILAAGAAATKLAMDAVESENLFEVSMGANAKAAREWSNQISDSLGLNEYAIRKNVATFNTMFESMKIGSQKSLEMSEGLTKLAYDMASFYNLGTEEAFQKLQSGISGEIEPLKRLGIVVSEASVKQYAYRNHIAQTGKELTENQKVMARYGLIMEATSKAQGDLARTAESPANKLRVLKESVTELAIKFGENLLPILEAVMKVVSPIINLFSKMNPTVLKTVTVIAMIAAAIGPVVALVGNISKAIGGVTSFIGTFNVQTLKTTAIVIGVVAALIALAAIIAVIAGKGNELNKTMQSVGSSVGNMTSIVNGASIPSYDIGTNYVPQDTIAMVHKGEKIIPASQNKPGASGGLTIVFQGPVYGVLDFEQKVKQIIRDAGLDGAFRGVFANG